MVERGGDRCVVLLLPDLYTSPGGIARLMRTAIEALEAAHFRCHAVALHDRAGAGGRRADGCVRVVPCAGSKVRFVMAALRLIGREKPNLVIAGHSHVAPVAWLCARWVRCPYVVFGYGVEVWRPLSRVRRAALRRASGVVSISTLTARRLARAQRVPTARTRAILPSLPANLGPDGGWERRYRGREPRLLTVARMATDERYKGHREVLRALPRLLTRFPDLRYDLVGDGDDRPALEREARELGVSGVVRFHGVVSEQALQALYRRASIFVMPSRGEGFGLVFLEAMTWSLPVVAGNDDATPEVVVDEETGLLVDATDVGAIGAAITRLLADPALAERLGRCGRLRVQTRFQGDRFRRELVAYLEEVMAGS